MGQGQEGNGLFLPAERTVSQTQLLRAWTQPAVNLGIGEARKHWVLARL